MRALKILLSCLFLSTITLYPQSDKGQLKTGIEDLLKGDFFKSTNIGIDIYDLTAGENLYQLNEKMLFNPASNMKLLTSAAGLVFLGPGYNFVTSLMYTGEILSKTLYGDFYIVGGFDPVFQTSDLNKFIADIKKAGINEIAGNIYGDIFRKDSSFWGQGWMWDDDPSIDAPYLSALNINSNSIDVRVNGTKQGEKAEVITSPATRYVAIFNNTMTSSVDPQKIKITRDWRNRKNDIYVKGYMLPPEFTSNDTIEYSLNIYKPELYFLTLFKERLEAEGIKFTGQLGLQKKPFSTRWLSVLSHEYDSVMVYMNKKSDNLSAEMTLYSLAASFNTYPVSASEGLEVIDSLMTLCGVKDDYELADGSGVSRYNLLSAEQILAVLKYMYYNDQNLYNIYYKSLPVAGVDGTLSERMNRTEAEGKVHAKTGTLKGVSCLSGYVTAKNNHLIAFSVLEQNFVDKTAYARYIQDKICELLSKYE